MPLAVKLPYFKSLTALDLSFNKVDESSKTIMHYLRSPSCTLVTLLLNGAGTYVRAYVHIVQYCCSY